MRTAHPDRPESPLAARVLFIDGEAILLDKPAGLPVDPPRDGSLSLENHFAGLTFGFQRWPVAVHRLDRDTSGCLLLARHPKAARRFTQAFEARQVEKRYLAILDGVPEATEGVIDMPLGKTSTKETGWRMRPDPRGKSAITRWQVLATREGRTLVAMMPETGRTHQLRAHALHGLGIGIIGDPIYRLTEGGGPGLGCPGTLLHSRFLRLARDNKAAIEGTAPVPESFHAAGFADADALDAEWAKGERTGPDERDG
jgi:tRNA pseudouridine32 synthase/23S rRNA pseudouridine746 synthase